MEDIIDLLNERREKCIKTLEEHKKELSKWIEVTSPNKIAILGKGWYKAYMEGKVEGVEECIEIVKKFLKSTDLM